MPPFDTLTMLNLLQIPSLCEAFGKSADIKPKLDEGLSIIQYDNFVGPTSRHADIVRDDSWPS
jgi:hypothetical protein